MRAMRNENRIIKQAPGSGRTCRLKRTAAAVLAAILAVSLLAGCGSSGSSGGAHGDHGRQMSYDDAKEELDALLTKVDRYDVTSPAMDIYSDEVTVADTLADIDTFPITVQGSGEINIEVAAPSEFTGEQPDDWLNAVAKKFNASNPKVDGKSVSVTVRKMASGEVVTYMTGGNYKPDMYIPSNYALGEMLRAGGIGVEKLADRVAGNTAGMLIKKDVYDTFTEKYGEANVASVLEATLAGDLTFAYTNPYTSATGLNILSAMLYSFDRDNPLSDTASSKLLDYQKQSPPVAYTTGVLRTQAAKGVINAMVMEEQAYVNQPELKSFVYIPAGIRHDHPVYTFDYVTVNKHKAAELFTEYMLSEESQKLATDKGFNRRDDYKSQDPGLDGAGYLAAQRVWKKNKNGGKPIIAVFVADTSGSMEGSPLSSLKESLVNSSTYISEDNYIGLISYSDDVTVNLPIERFDARQRAYFSGEVKALTARGSTATYDAVLVAMKEMLDKKEEVPDAKMMLFVLSDGEQNEGYSLSRIAPVVEGLGVPIYTIGYNFSDTSELEDLSEINEAATIKANTDDVVNHLRNLFSVEM